MKILRATAAMLAIVAAITMVSSAGGAGNGNGKKIDLSTDQAIAAYLLTLGVDPAGVAIQRGPKNYAGPACPGPGWNCTTATRVVQIAEPGGRNLVQCGDPALFGADLLAAPLAAYIPATSCFAVQENVGGTSTIDVRQQRTTDNNATLNCAGGTQQTTGGQNHFRCHQVIKVSGSELVQSGKEIAAIKQIAVGGGNHSNIYQEISLTSRVDAPAGAQKQNAYQSSVVDQEATAGATNHSSVHEAQYLRARISGATTSNQYQNTDPLPAGVTDCVPESLIPFLTNPNSCANISQQADGGHQESQLKLVNDLDARTTAASGSQNLGGATTGLDGTVPQPAVGSTDTSHEDYDERQNATAGGPGVAQNLTAPQSCCALQTGSAPNSRVTATQTSVQRATTSATPLEPSGTAVTNPNAVESTYLAGKIQTNGQGTLKHDARQGGGTHTAQCSVPGSESEPACALVTVMVNGQPFTCEPGEVIVPEPEPPPAFRCEDLPPVLN